ncbi:[Fe-Fe] hydrogenase large subunit C-terminal domain-containing protein [Gorillibacterium massiliense]|uniref:[Fe-Fe] hydrogenase large subunit C-terminal domain-containing protein n=1 Tax=Gorillibacterium massiliense TaxID=1280390 RepID=UPI0004B93DBF|nr:[Fe-Fe] hydrogenase large subunit C-terminal domain-containing protein [Gorillibacterium massiliense]
MTKFLNLKKSNCKNCYKCIRHCPVKSIRFSGNQAHIVEDECILCGKCFVVCPQNAKEIADSTEMARVMLGGDEPVVASMAPSFVAHYGVGIAPIEAALKKLGFAGAEETAIGATMVKKEYDRMLNEGRRDIVISSCCPSVNLLIQTYYPKALPYLADVVSPMVAHCLDIKRRIPGAKTVFIGPCLSKKDEAEKSGGAVDCAMTFEELSQWLEAENIRLEAGMDQTEESRARFFPTTGGILKTMLKSREDYSYMAIDGVENCMAALEDIGEGNLSRCFIEMSACTGSCIGGPVMGKAQRAPVRSYNQVATYAGKKDFPVDTLPPELMYKHGVIPGPKPSAPGVDEIEAILRKMGKSKREHELNCGSCGYNTCRDKASAVYQGKANLSMCLPFLKDKAESFSENIIHNTPNGIIVLNEDLEVQQINVAARRILNLRSAAEVMGEPIVRLLDPKDFQTVRSTGRSIRDRKRYLAEYERYVEETIIYDKEYRILIGILRDITDLEKDRVRKESFNRQTVDIADKVVEKQMRVVQEIASLLGETVAETKIALTKLKKSIEDE